MSRYSDPRCYNNPKQRKQAAVARGQAKRLWCKHCRGETMHSWGSKYDYCLECMRNKD